MLQSMSPMSAIRGMTHTGTGKADRNLKLLLRELEAQPDDSYTLYQIGNSYFYSKQYAQAIPYFEQAMELPLDTKLSYVHSIINLYATA